MLINLARRAFNSVIKRLNRCKCSRYAVVFFYGFVALEANKRHIRELFTSAVTSVVLSLINILLLAFSNSGLTLKSRQLARKLEMLPVLPALYGLEPSYWSKSGKGKLEA